MPLADYLIGLAFLVGTLGAVGVAAALVARRRLPSLRGAPRALAYLLLASAGVLAVHLLPGALGLLSRESVLAAALLACLATLLVPPTASGVPVPDPAG